MGRSVPSVSRRMDHRLMQWEKFGRLLSREERHAYRRLVTVMRNRRTAIGEADEADIGIAMLLAVAAYMEREICSMRK
jgi:hypothetical protein